MFGGMHIGSSASSGHANATDLLRVFHSFPEQLDSLSGPSLSRAIRCAESSEMRLNFLPFRLDFASHTVVVRFYSFFCFVKHPVHLLSTFASLDSERLPSQGED